MPSQQKRSSSRLLGACRIVSHGTGPRKRVVAWLGILWTKPVDWWYDLLMYDITGTYFEGEAAFPLAQRGYSRDNRSDCKHVCIGLVVSGFGMPLGYQVFAGNTTDVTTVEYIVGFGGSLAHVARREPRPPGFAGASFS